MLGTSRSAASEFIEEDVENGQLSDLDTSRLAQFRDYDDPAGMPSTDERAQFLIAREDFLRHLRALQGEGSLTAST